MSDIVAELSRAKGEIDAAHVVLTAAGVDCPEASLQDRIARYIGETETKLEAAERREAEKDKALEAIDMLAFQMQSIMTPEDTHPNIGAIRAHAFKAALGRPSTPSPAPLNPRLDDAGTTLGHGHGHLRVAPDAEFQRIVALNTPSPAPSAEGRRGPCSMCYDDDPGDVCRHCGDVKPAPRSE